MARVEARRVVRGSTCKFKEDNIVVIGDHNEVMGRNCVVQGDYNHVYGDGCTIKGDHNYVHGPHAIINGDWNNMHNRIYVSESGQFNKFVGRALDSRIKTQPASILQNVVFGGSIGEGVSIVQSGRQRTTVIGSMHGDFKGTAWNDRKILLRGLTGQSVTSTPDSIIIGGDLSIRPDCVTYKGRLVAGLDVDSFTPDAQLTYDAVVDLCNASLRSKRPRESEDDDDSAPASSSSARPVKKHKPMSIPSGEDEEADEECQECVVCREKKAKCRIRDCNHVIMCIQCTRTILDKDKPTCPKCRRPIIKGAKTVFI